MRVIKEISCPGNQFNEDLLSYCHDSFVLVLDGSTGLGENKLAPGADDIWNTDAQWFVQEFSALLTQHVDHYTSIKDLVSECIQELSKNYWERVPEATNRINQPSASMALLKKTKDIYELLVIGDITVFIQNKTGSIELIENETIKKLDNQVIEQIKKESQISKTSIREAGQLAVIRELLKQNRMKKNTEDGYWVLGLEPAAVNYGYYKQLTTDEWDRIFICSDGFYSYKDYGLLKKPSDEHFVKVIMRRPLKSLCRKIRKCEERDPLYQRHPRFKLSDDATAVLVVSNQEKREKLKDGLLFRTNVTWHRIKGKLQSNLVTFGIKKSYMIAILTALGTLAKLFFDITQNEMIKLDMITWGLFAIMIMVALVTVISSIITYRAYTKNYFIYSDQEKKAHNQKKLLLRKEQENTGYQIKTFYNGRENEHYIMSREVNDFLLKNSPIMVNDLKHSFSLAEKVKQFVPAIMELTLQKKKITYNGKLLRQISDLYPGISSVNVQKVKYFDGQCTNEITYKQFKSVYDIDLAFDGIRLLMDDAQYCYPLDYSSCANFIGVSTIVLTRDLKIIIGRQGQLSMANQGRYAPSGSGSVGYADIRKSKARLGSNKKMTLHDVLITAMMREFCEECNYSQKKAEQKMRTQIIGYARLLERGGKPDYFAVSYIDEDSRDIMCGLRHAEYGLMNNFSILHCHKFADIPYELRKFCSENTARQISIQLEIMTQILENIAETQRMDELIGNITK